MDSHWLAGIQICMAPDGFKEKFRRPARHGFAGAAVLSSAVIQTNLSNDRSGWFAAGPLTDRYITRGNVRGVQRSVGQPTLARCHRKLSGMIAAHADIPVQPSPDPAMAITMRRSRLRTQQMEISAAGSVGSDGIWSSGRISARATSTRAESPATNRRDLRPPILRLTLFRRKHRHPLRRSKGALARLRRR
jgi:hypothetical protein